MDKKLVCSRSEKIRKAILIVAYELLIENNFRTVTIEKIAERAGVSKATIYKLWTNKSMSLLMLFLTQLL